MAVDQWSVPRGNWIPKPFASETITISTSALPLTAATYDPSASGLKSVQAFITCASNDVRYWVDGSTPTATVGHVLASGGSLVLSRSDMVGFKAIATAAGDGVISVTYFCAAEP